MTRCLLAEAKLPKMFWVRARSTAVRVRNLCPTSSNKNAFHRQKCTLGNIKSELFACVQLPGVLSVSRKQTETGSKGQEKQVHWLRRGEQSLPADGPGDEKTSGVSKKRDIH